MECGVWIQHALQGCLACAILASLTCHSIFRNLIIMTVLLVSNNVRMLISSVDV